MIIAEGLSKLYGARRALTDVSFRIAENEVVGFLGLNGAGKTTVLKILSGLLVASSGRVHVDGLDLAAHPMEVRRRIGFLPDRPPLYPELTVRQMLTHTARLNGVVPARVETRVFEVLRLCELDDVADDLIEWLSHGFRQRVGIAQAIVHEPKLVILDEPISGLDPAQIVAMRGLIRGLKDKHTVLLSSHILPEISQTCDRLLVLHQGRIVAQGSESDLVPAGRGRVEVVLRGAADVVKNTKLPAHDVVVETMPGALLRVRATVESEAAREELVRALVQSGCGVRAVRDVESGLESVFLSLTERSEPGVSP
jgi:ABC-2 type transport system ATP-binding protein